MKIKIFQLGDKDLPVLSFLGQTVSVLQKRVARESSPEFILFCIRAAPPFRVNPSGIISQRITRGNSRGVNSVDNPPAYRLSRHAETPRLHRIRRRRDGVRSLACRHPASRHTQLSAFHQRNVARMCRPQNRSPHCGERGTGTLLETFRFIFFFPCHVHA